MKNAIASLIVVSMVVSGCFLFEKDSNAAGKKGRAVFFVGVDISGSFKRGKYFNDSLKFISHYLYGHLRGIGGMARLGDLYVGAIGGAKPNEPKTFFPIQTFQYKAIPEIESKLHEIFPKKRVNRFTDFNAFFRQITTFVKNKKLLMKPITIILLTDGVPDTPKKNGQHDYRSFNLKPLENLSRNITVRVLYTSAQIGMNWQEKVPRKRVKVWTQDANVMTDWKSKDIFQPKLQFEKKERLFDWIKDNVDFPVRKKRVN